tara:strand:+ start:273 stop:1427 length:1155 start_codon:yes stop_codon:yes gene_type:complete
MNHKEIKRKIIDLKKHSGSHSPSIETVLHQIPELKISIDACFLSNPYATELFFDQMKFDLFKNNEILKYLEYYPPQNYEVSRLLSKSIDINPKNIFVGNGAIEIIQAIIQRFVKNKLAVIIPTFSSYYEFARKDTNVIFYKLKREDNFILDVNDYISFIKKEKPDSIAIINPNNPDGGYINTQDILKITNELNFVDNIIIDESFVHFAYEDSEFNPVGLEKMAINNDKIILVKSMSKDFGIAGIRAGYSIMSQDKVAKLLENGYLWNVSGLAYYFFKLFSSKQFLQKYNLIRKKYIAETKDFLALLKKIDQFIVYPSKANFALVELPKNISSFDFSMDLLIKHGIYVRDCSDKIGLIGNYIRMASRGEESNNIIINSLKDFVNE